MEQLPNLNPSSKREAARVMEDGINDEEDLETPEPTPMEELKARMLGQLGYDLEEFERRASEGEAPEHDMALEELEAEHEAYIEVKRRVDGISALIGMVDENRITPKKLQVVRNISPATMEVSRAAVFLKVLDLLEEGK